MYSQSSSPKRANLIGILPRHPELSSWWNRLSFAADVLGLGLVVVLMWRVFFTTEVAFSWLAVSIGVAGAVSLLLGGRSLRTCIDGPIVCYLAFTLASAAASYGRYPAFAGVIPVAAWHPGVHLTVVVVYFYGLVYLLKTARRLSAAVAGLTVALTALGLIAVYDHARYGFDTRIWDYPLLPQWIGYPQIGLLLAVGFPLAAAVAMEASSYGTVVGSSLVALVMAGMVTTMYSRGALVAVAAAYVALCAIELGKFKTRRFTTAAVALLLTTMIGVTALGRTQWIASFWASSQFGFNTTTSLTTRGAVWRRTAAMIRDSPVLGVGPGNYTVVLEQRYVEEKLRENGHAHNMILHIAAEQGVPAAVAFLLIWYRLGSMLWRRSDRTHTGVVAVACFAALVAFFTRSLTDHFLSSTGSPSERTAFVMWTLLSLAAAVDRMPAAEAASVSMEPT